MGMRDGRSGTGIMSIVCFSAEGGRSMKKRGLSKLFLGLISLFLLAAVFVMPASAATSTGRTPITAYTRYTGNVTTYSNMSWRRTGYIYGRTDRCKILSVYSNGWCRVQYPVSYGYKTAYTPTSNFFISTSFSTSTVRSGSYRTVYRYSNGTGSIGTVYPSDYLTIIGRTNGYTQVIYPISGGYKLGFVRGTVSSSGSGSGPVSISNGYYYIKSALNTNMQLDVYDASRSDCANLILYHSNGGSNQVFYFRRLSNGNYRITAKHSGKVLDVKGGPRYNGASVIQYSLNSPSTQNQEWTLYRFGDGYRLQSAGSGYSLDVNNAEAYDGNKIQVWQNNNTYAQKFYLVSASGGSSSNSSGSSGRENTKRSNAVSYMKQMATVVWTPSSSFRHWSYNGKSNTHIWTAGRTYYGIPYSQRSRYTNLEGFRSLLYGSRYYGPAGQSTYKGSDCSSAVCYAYRHVNSSFPVSDMTTYTLLPRSGYTKAVGNYGYQGYSYSSTICRYNGSYVMKNSYRSLRAGDLVVNNTDREHSHVMMVTGTYGSGVYCTHQTTLNSARNSTWRVNEAISYDYLYRNNYIGVTMKNW